MRAGECLLLLLVLLQCGCADESSAPAQLVSLPGAAVYQRIVPTPVRLRGLFSFARKYAVDTDGGAVAPSPMHVSGSPVGDYSIHDHVSPAKLLAGPEYWVELASLEAAAAQGVAVEGHSDVSAGATSLVLRIGDDAELTVDFEGVPEGRVGDMAFRSPGTSERTVWAMHMEPDDDGVSFVLNGLPEPAVGSLVLVFSGDAGSGAFSDVTLTVQGGGDILIVQDQAGWLVRAAD